MAAPWPKWLGSSLTSESLVRSQSRTPCEMHGAQCSRATGFPLSNEGFTSPYHFTSRLHLKRDGTRAEIRFRLSAKRTSPFKSAGASVQSTAGSRGVRISGSNASNAGYAMFRGSVKNTGFPLHSPVSPSLPLPCVTVCHHISTGPYATVLFAYRKDARANPAVIFRLSKSIRQTRSSTFSVVQERSHPLSPDRDKNLVMILTPGLTDRMSL